MSLVSHIFSRSALIRINARNWTKNLSSIVSIEYILSPYALRVRRCSSSYRSPYRAQRGAFFLELLKGSKQIVERLDIGDIPGQSLVVGR
jgi:hypothetical protein